MSQITSDISTAEHARLRRRVADLEQQLDTLLTTTQEGATKQLLQSLSLVEAAFESTADGILVVDLTGRITRWNQRFAQLWRTPLQFLESGDDQAVLGHGTQQLRDPASFFEQVSNLYAQPEAESFDILDFADDRVFERYSCPQRIGTTIVGRVWCFRDVTARVRAERERIQMQEQVITMQAAALAELSTPLIPISNTTVVMPLIGSIDSRRAQQIMETLLSGISSQQAAIAILDITGVVTVDTHVADALLRAAQAVKLLGAQAILTGIRPEVAQLIVALDIDLTNLATFSTLQAGIAYALKQR